LSTRDLIGKARAAYRRDGLSYLLKKGSELGFHLAINGVVLLYYRIFKANCMFEFNGVKYHYFYSLYGATWRSERAVEIPIVWRLVDNANNDGKKILEVGNVLSYRFRVFHDILDKYDKIDGVINQDVVDYNPRYKYDLIVSISTLEHVGYDKQIKDPMKIIKSLQNLKSLLNSGGKIVVTLPLGQNKGMDDLIAKKILIFDKMYYMKRVKNLEWKHVKEIDPKEVDYNPRVPTANAIIIGISDA